ncbi:hypothetical protein ACXU40_05110 [Bordetella bronchiseptica]
MSKQDNALEVWLDDELSPPCLVGKLSHDRGQIRFHYERDWSPRPPAAICRSPGLTRNIARWRAQQIDQKLESAGWVIQDMKQLDLGTGLGVAMREYPTDTGPADYLLFVNRTTCDVMEAKKDRTGENLTVTENQTERYAELADKGGSQKAWGLFGKELYTLMTEMNEELVT